MAATSRLASIGSYFRRDRTKSNALLLFLFLAFAMGGGARDDILSLVLLRPLSILFIAYALSVADEKQIRSVGAPLYLLLALAILIAIQLIPLPADIWGSLSGRRPYSDISELAGLKGIWRPPSLSPSKTLNSLFSLSVPMAALCLFAVQRRDFYRIALIAVALLAVVSSLLGLLQMGGASTGPLYLYRITNPGLPVGFFANRNHHAVVLAALLPLIAHIGLSARSDSWTGGFARLAAPLAIMLVVPTILMTGSRAGLICMVMGLAVAAALAIAAGPRKAAAALRGVKLSGSKPLLLTAFGLAAIVAVIALWFGRALAIERLFSSDEIEGLRSRLLPILVRMAREFFPVGSGFGSFEHVYDQFEPTSLLRDQYLNQAHNDWLQLMIEGGLPAAMLAGLFMLWLGLQGARTFRLRWSDRPSTFTLRVASLSFMVVIGVASAFDYPLRVPSVMVLFAIFCVALARTDGAGGPRTPANI